MPFDLKKLTTDYASSRFIRENYYEKNSPVSFDSVLQHGIALEIDYYGNEKCNIAPYSVKIHLDKNVTYSENDKFFPPFLPIHQIALPQVGEEIWLFCPLVNSTKNAMWLSRVNYISDFSSNRVDLLHQYGYTDNNNLLFGTGLNKQDVKEKYDVEPLSGYSVPYMRIKPGDVLTHGRSNTHVIHSFDTNNKRGVIDMLTEVTEPKHEFTLQEFHSISGSRILLTTKHNIDETVLEKDLSLSSHRFFSPMSYKQDDAYALMQSVYNRIISVSGHELNHMVLAERQREWISDLLYIISLLIQQQIKLGTMLYDFIMLDYRSHEHPVIKNKAVSVDVGSATDLEKFLVVDNDYELKRILSRYNLHSPKNIQTLMDLYLDIKNHHSKFNACN
jgi:hypothetical protein